MSDAPDTPRPDIWDDDVEFDEDGFRVGFDGRDRYNDGFTPHE